MESPRCSVGESTGEKGAASSVGLKSEVGRLFVLPQASFWVS